MLRRGAALVERTGRITCRIGEPCARRRQLDGRCEQVDVQRHDHALAGGLCHDRDAGVGEYHLKVHPSRFNDRWSPGTVDGDASRRQMEAWNVTMFVMAWDGSDVGYPPNEYAQGVAVTAEGHAFPGRWSTGTRRTGIAPNDRIVLLRQHTNRGVIAVGRAVDGRIKPREHWADPKSTAPYIDLSWETVLPIQDRLAIEDLLQEVPDFKWNNVYSSGQVMSAQAEAQFNAAWARHTASTTLGSSSTSSVRVMLIWSAKGHRGSENLRLGLETGTWGFKDDPRPIGPIDYVLFGRNHSGGGPRQGTATWAGGTADLILGEATAPLFTGHAPLWPDEVAQGALIYPYRLGFTPLAEAPSARLGQRGGLGSAVTESLRLAGTSNRPVVVSTTRTQLQQLFSLGPTAGGQRVNLGVSTASARIVRRGSTSGTGGPGRSNDPAWRSAVEQHAVRMAKEHMRALGWTRIVDLGKPFDLVCHKADGTEKHVEVKGTSTAGAAVEFTVNEVDHFHDCPHGADLIVVRDIAVDTTTTPYTTSGGDLLHLPNYLAPSQDLAPTRWSARIAWP